MHFFGITHLCELKSQIDEQWMKYKTASACKVQTLLVFFALQASVKYFSYLFIPVARSEEKMTALHFATWSVWRRDCCLEIWKYCLWLCHIIRTKVVHFPNMVKIWYSAIWDPRESKLRPPKHKELVKIVETVLGKLSYTKY